jgi:hypothetical protein
VTAVEDGVGCMALVWKYVETVRKNVKVSLGIYSVSEEKIS